jgi:hypothetical protein
MLQMYTWTWISINFAVTYLAIVWGSMLFHFSGSAYPGSRNYMWCLSFFVNLPSFLGLDSVSSTSTFKAAAVRKGYPGAAYFHTGFYTRFFAFATGVIFFQVAWLLFCFPGGLLFQWEYDMYILYASVAIYTPLLLFILLPRYANMCKSRDALLGRIPMPADDGSVYRGQPRREHSVVVSGGRIAGRRRSMTSAFFEGSSAPVPPRGIVTLTQPRVEMSERLLPTSPAHSSETIVTTNFEEVSELRPLRIDEKERNGSGPVRFIAPSELRRSRLSRNYTEGDRHAQQPVVPTPEPNPAEPASTTTDVEEPHSASMVLSWKPAPWEPGGRAEVVGAPTTMAWQGSHRDPLPPLHAKPLSPLPPPAAASTDMRNNSNALGVGADRSGEHDDDDSSHGTNTTGRPVGGRLKRYATARLLGRAKVGVFGDGSSMPIHQSVGKPPKSRNGLASFGVRSASIALSTEHKVEIMERAEEGRAPRPSASSSAAPVISRLTGLSNLARDATNFVLFAMRGSFTPLKIIGTGVVGLPAGARLLLVNVTAALHHFRDNWRWWVATQTDKVTPFYLSTHSYTE